MGVRHLYTFITKNVENGCYPISIPDKVKEFKRKHPDRTPIIIVDMFAIHDKFYTNDHEVLLGGRYNLYNERARKMFENFQLLDVKLIFFFDGPMHPEKLETCLKRRNEEYYDFVNILNAIDCGLDLSCDLKSKGLKRRNLTPFCSNFKKYIKKYAELRMSTLNECDQEMAFTANKLNAMAIITHDTDFLIYEGNWEFWSANDFNFKTLTTLELNKNALRAKLSLSSRQMALLGTLGGNDILQYEMVEVSNILIV